MASKIARLAAGVLDARGDLRPDLTDAQATDLLFAALDEATTWTPGNRRLATDTSEMVSPSRRAAGRVSRWSAPDEDVTEQLDQVLEHAWKAATDRLGTLVHDSWAAPVLRFAVDDFGARRDLLKAAPTGGRKVIPIVARFAERFAWQWPLRVAIVEGPQSARWTQEVRSIHERYWHLYSVEVVGAANVSSDQIVIADASGLGDVPPCSTLVIVGDGQSGFDELNALANDRRDGIVLLSRTPHLGWFGEMVIELSHDYPLDAAVETVTDEVAVVADPHLLGLTSVRAHGEWLGEQLASMAPGESDEPVELLVKRFHTVAGEPMTLPLREAGSFLLEVVTLGRFDSELGSGSDVAAAGEAVAALSTATGHPTHIRRLETARAAATPEPEPTPSDDRRLGVEFFHEQKKLERALVANEDIRLLVSIGHEGATASLPTPIQVDFGGAPVRTLQVRVLIGDDDQTKPLTLVRNPGIPGFVEFTVRVAAPRLSGFVIVYNEDQSQVLQAANLSADVVASPEAAEAAAPSIRMSIVDAGAINSLSRPNRGTIVSDGARTAASGHHLQLHANAGSVLREIENTVRAIKTAAGNFVAGVGSIDETLIGIAKAGVRLRDDLGVGKLEPFAEIQVVSFTKNVVLPIEWVYGGESPDPNAKVCTTWKTSAPGERHCPSCSALQAPAQRKVVCPSRFWGLGKVIEHHHSEEPLGSDYVARVRASEATTVVTVRGASLIGASTMVLQALGAGAEDPNPNVLLADVIDAASRLGPPSWVENWTAWRDSVAAHGPSLLIAMPHHGEVEVGHLRSPALELGGDFESTVSESHVRKQGSSPGPVVLLIGCDTGVADRALSSFASKFQTWSPVVVATVGEIIAEEANLVVRAVLDALSTPTQLGHATMGDVVTAARRDLLKQSRLSGLQLVLHGEAIWEIGG